MKLTIAYGMLWDASGEMVLHSSVVRVFKWREDCVVNVYRVTREALPKSGYKW